MTVEVNAHLCRHDAAAFEVAGRCRGRGGHRARLGSAPMGPSPLRCRQACFAASHAANPANGARRGGERTGACALGQPSRSIEGHRHASSGRACPAGNATADQCPRSMPPRHRFPPQPRSCRSTRSRRRFHWRTGTGKDGRVTKGDVLEFLSPASFLRHAAAPARVCGTGCAGTPCA